METLIKAYKGLSRDKKKSTKNWYRQASNFASHLSKTYSVSYDKVCAVIAALSPACNWYQNKKDASLLIEVYISDGNISDYNFCTYGPNVVKALEILRSDKDPASFFSMKTGPKTFNFYHNILRPFDPSFVTIDRHAVAVYEGRTNSGSVRLTTKQYEKIASDYIQTAIELNILPNELQAILWAGHLSNRTNVNGK